MFVVFTIVTFLANWVDGISEVLTLTQPPRPACGSLEWLEVSVWVMQVTDVLLREAWSCSPDPILETNEIRYFDQDDHSEFFFYKNLLYKIKYVKIISHSLVYFLHWNFDLTRKINFLKRISPFTSWNHSQIKISV